MKSARIAFMVLLLLGSAAITRIARADGAPPVDPDIDVSDPTCGEFSCPGVGLTFSFSSNAAGGGSTTLQNASGQSWFSLLIETGSNPFNVPANTVVCTTNAFLNCQVFNLGGGITAIFLSGVSTVTDTLLTESFTAGGIANGANFTINLNDTGLTTGSWGANREFDATANASSPVPEPATLTLLGIGLGALLAKRKFPGLRLSHN